MIIAAYAWYFLAGGHTPVTPPLKQTDLSRSEECSIVGQGVHLELESTHSGERPHHDEETCVLGPRFQPPVYIQRYCYVEKVLRLHQVESMVDFGCAECQMLTWLKGLDRLQRLFLVDIDRQPLHQARRNLQPLHCDYLRRRQRPLTVTLLCGSAAHLDPRLAQCQAASLVEIIEHLQPDVLQQVTLCVFGRLRPDLVIVTTPNADFNILFPNFSGFRHWDHKFEWTKAEFQNWCEAICSQHGYCVTYDGVGDPPADRKDLGHCSQIAVFTKQDSGPGETAQHQVYTLIEEVSFPYDGRSFGERLAGDVDYAVNVCMRQLQQQDPSAQRASIAVADIMQLMHSQQDQPCSLQQVTEYLEEHHLLTEARDSIVVNLEEDSSSTCSDASSDDQAGDSAVLQATGTGSYQDHDQEVW